MILHFGKILLPLQFKKTLEASFGYTLFDNVSIVYGLTMIVVIFRKVRRHSKAIANQYSSTENRELNWLNVVTLSILFLYFFAVVSAIFFPDFMAELFMSFFGLFITFWVAYNGLLQQQSINLVSMNNGNTNKTNSITENISQEEV